MNVNEYVANEKNWKRTGKKQYEIWCCMPPIDTAVYNKFEDCHYKTNEKKRFVLSGTEGEQWVIDAGKLASTYTLADGEEINEVTLRRKLSGGAIEWFKVRTKRSGVKNYALFLNKRYVNFPVATSWGDVLMANRNGIGHDKGDFLVCAVLPNGLPNLSDMWVVNGNIFPKTYDLHAFPGAFACIANQQAVDRPTDLFNSGVGKTATKTATKVANANNGRNYDTDPNRMPKQYGLKEAVRRDTEDGLESFNWLKNKAKNWADEVTYDRGNSIGFKRASRGGNDYDDETLCLTYDKSTNSFSVVYCSERGTEYKGTGLKHVDSIITGRNGLFSTCECMVSSIF